MAHLLRRYVIAPTNVDQHSACSCEIVRTPLFIVGTGVLDAPKKTNGENQQYGGAPNPPFIVGTGVLDCPFRYESKFFPRRTVRQLVARTPCPYRGLDDFRLFVRSRKTEQATWRRALLTRRACRTLKIHRYFKNYCKNAESVVK